MELALDADRHQPQLRVTHYQSLFESLVAQQSLAKAVLDRNAVAQSRQHHGHALGGDLDRGEHRTGLAVEPGDPRPELGQGIDRSGAAESGSPGYGGQVY